MSGIRRRLPDERGFTLVELLVTMSLSLIVVAIATGSVIQALQTQRRQVRQVAIQAEANKALERMTRELRAANPLLGTPSAEQAMVQVTRGSVRTTTTYTLVPTTPGRQRIDQTRTVEDLAASPVTSSTTTTTLLDGLALPAGAALFTYHGDDGAPLTTAPISPAAVRSVTVRLVLALPETSAVLDLGNEIMLRNGA
ncbi:MAG: prepilin-type N-terminal cleavage/methylation domain-containing protein [Actinomycetota bacterium]|nr:prepilin-type N-terminal cleavage/methylation domain-containing protein [Actinomycetota bacterium]